MKLHGTCSVACLFPHPPVAEVWREPLLQTLGERLESAADIDVVTVEGPEGIGKTVFLSQFARCHPDRTVSIFVRPGSKCASDISVVRFDLCNQIHWLLRGVELSPDTDTAGLRGDLVAQLLKRARLLNSPVWFIVDGLDELTADPADTETMIGDVLDMVPLGTQWAKCLLAVARRYMPDRMAKRLAVSSFPLTVFSSAETAQYLDGLGIDPESLREIHNSCRGYPGRLSAVRRLLAARMPLDELLPNLHTKLPALFEIEWGRVGPGPEELLLLAILAHARIDCTTDRLTEIAGIDRAVIDASLGAMPFIEQDRRDSWMFASASFRSFAVAKLQSQESRVDDLVVQWLRRDPASEHAIRCLPEYLDKEGRYDDLRECLSIDNLQRVLARSPSLAEVRNALLVAGKAAAALGRDTDVFRYALLSAVLADVQRSRFASLEIGALAALGDWDSAVAIARAVPFREIRLPLLAAIARRKREAGLAPEVELTDEISRLCGQLSDSDLGPHTVELAAELVHSNAALAVGLVRRVAGLFTGQNSLDWAFAALALSASSRTEEQSVAEELKSKIRDPVMKFYASSLALVARGSAKDAISQAAVLKGAGDQLFFLRLWLRVNRTRDDAPEVARYALDLAVRSGDYVPNAGVLRDIATIVPHVPADEARALVSRLDGLMGAATQQGPSVEYVRLQLLLARAEARYDSELSRHRLDDTYFAVHDMRDLSTKCLCLAHLVATAADPAMSYGEHNYAALEADLLACFNELLSVSADHYQATEGIFRALTRRRPQLALSLADSLNTEDRRDAARREIAVALVRMPPEELDGAFLSELLRGIQNPTVRDSTIVEMLSYLGRVAQPSPAYGPVLIGLLPLAADPTARCQACCLAYSCDSDPSFRAELEGSISDAWRSLGQTPEAIDAGLHIAAELAHHSPSLARQYFDLASSLRRSVPVIRGVARVLEGTTLLGIRAFGGLLPRRLGTTLAERRLAKMIAGVPAPLGRAFAWATLAMVLQRLGTQAEAEEIAEKHLLPLLQYAEEPCLQSRLAAVVAPATYRGAKHRTLDLVKRLPNHLKDDTLVGIALAVMRGVHPAEPYDDTGPTHQYVLAYDDILDVVQLTELLDADSGIYLVVRHVASSALRLTAQQRADIATKLRRVVAQKLPNPRLIRHRGWAVACEAQLLRMSEAQGTPWGKLRDDASAIPNTADKALVLAILAAAMPMRREHTKVREAIIRDVEELAKGIPSALDRIDRLIGIAATVAAVDRQAARRMLLAARASIQGLADISTEEKRQDLIDAAHRLDPSLAATFCDLADEDPARNSPRAALMKRINVLELRRNALSEVGDACRKPEDWASACRMLLGDLNAGTSTHVHFSKYRTLLLIAASAPFRVSYPIFAWVLENCVVRHSSKDQASDYIPDLFSAAVDAYEICGHLGDTSTREIMAGRTLAAAGATGSFVVEPSSGDEAERYVREWLHAHALRLVTICDPYFGTSDLHTLLWFMAEAPDCRIEILTSDMSKPGEPTGPRDREWSGYWYSHVSEQAPPDADVIVVRTESGHAPIHGRWLLSDDAGMKLGVSFNALRKGRIDQLSSVSSADLRAAQLELEPYLTRHAREHGGERLIYDVFTLHR